MESFELGRVLWERRDYIGIPKAEIARRAEVSESYVRMVEQGIRRPSKGVLERWTTALGWDASYTRQLLVLAGHATQEQESTPSPSLPFAASALHFPQPRRMERERVIQELLGVLNRAEESEEGWQETLGLIGSFLEWLKFRVEKLRELEAVAEQEQQLSFAQRIYLQITGRASEVRSFFDEVAIGNVPELKVARAPKEDSNIFTRQVQAYEARVCGTVVFTAHVTEKLAYDYVKSLIEKKFPESRIEVKITENAESP